MSSPPEAPPLTLRGIAVVGVRLMGLYFLARALVSLPLAASGHLWSVAATAVVGLGLWGGVHRVVNAMLPARSAASVNPASPDAGLAGHLAFAALGVFVVCDSVPELVRVALTQWQAARPDWLPLVQAAAPPLMGLLVFFGAGGLVRLVEHLRHAGR